MMQVDVTRKPISKLSGIKIAIDLTPLLPGGENGGAKLMAIELVNALATLLPETDFVLLTAEVSHSELDWLEKEHSNIRRMCVLHNNSQITPSVSMPPIPSTWRDKALDQLKIIAGDILPSELKHHIKALPLSFSALSDRALNRLRTVLPSRLRQRISHLLRIMKPTTKSLLRQIDVNLLFCPFTAPFYADPLIPTVSVIYDLQYRAYPQFFAPAELIQREDNFSMAYKRANYLVAISEYVRQTVIEAANLSPERVIAVPIGLLRNLRHQDDTSAGYALLENYNFQPGEYVFYPANFWKHKNHAMLLTAFSIYRQSNPDSMLKLLCTGTPGPSAEAFCEAVRRMGLMDWVIYPGYVTPDEYDFLLTSAFAMIFPSLYEGFGIPVLEAMSAGIPVLCSNVTSLPEVGGDAALYFNPCRPIEIVDALIRLSKEPGLRRSLIERGLQRATIFEGADRMAYQYIDVFIKALLPQANGKRTTGN